MKSMKKYLLILPIAALAFGCHDYKADIDRLQSEKEAIAQSTVYKDSSITSFIAEVNEIENNLSKIEKKQGTIAETSNNAGELKGKQIDRINENIREINDLMKENRARIAELSKKLKGSNVKVDGLEKMIASLNEQLGEKDKQLADLNAKLVVLNTQVDKLNTDVTSLTAESTEKTKVIDDQTSKLHTAYYTTGTFKELKMKKVVDKQGGILGIGAEKTVNKNLDQSAFNTIDITKTSTIPLDAKDAVVLTNHPTSSYTIEHTGKTVSNLQITDPEKFWKSSKYLVVVVDK